MLRRCVPSMFQATPVALGMFHSSTIRYPLYGEKETTNMSRRIAPLGARNLGSGDHRQKVWQYRFKEMGSSMDRVWVALGGRMRRRRIGRSDAQKDLRYYWRPIEQHSQKIYMSKFRTRNRSLNEKKPMALRAPNAELTLNRRQPLFNKVQLPANLYKANSPPKNLDFEFRVY